MTRENDDQTDIIKSIKAEGGRAKKWAARFGVGNPDLICSLPGIGIFLLEVKTPEGKLSPKQIFELEEWRKAGGKAYVVIVDRKKWLEINGIVCQWLPRLKIYWSITSALGYFRKANHDKEAAPIPFRTKANPARSDTRAKTNSVEPQKN